MVISLLGWFPPPPPPMAYISLCLLWFDCMSSNDVTNGSENNRADQNCLWGFVTAYGDLCGWLRLNDFKLNKCGYA